MRKKNAETRLIGRIIAKKKDRRQYGRIRCDVGKPRANPVTQVQVITTDSEGVQITHEGNDAVHVACMEHIVKRYNYNQGNNSPFSTGRMLEDPGLSQATRNLMKRID